MNSPYQQQLRRPHSLSAGAVPRRHHRLAGSGSRWHHERNRLYNHAASEHAQPDSRHRHRCGWSGGRRWRVWRSSGGKGGGVGSYGRHPTLRLRAGTGGLSFPMFARGGGIGYAEGARRIFRRLICRRTSMTSRSTSPRNRSSRRCRPGDSGACAATQSQPASSVERKWRSGGVGDIVKTVASIAPFFSLRAGVVRNPYEASPEVARRRRSIDAQWPYGPEGGPSALDNANWPSGPVGARSDVINPDEPYRCPMRRRSGIGGKGGCLDG